MSKIPVLTSKFIDSNSMKGSSESSTPSPKPNFSPNGDFSVSISSANGDSISKSDATLDRSLRDDFSGDSFDSFKSLEHSLKGSNKINETTNGCENKMNGLNDIHNGEKERKKVTNNKAVCVGVKSKSNLDLTKSYSAASTLRNNRVRAQIKPHNCSHRPLIPRNQLPLFNNGFHKSQFNNGFRTNRLINQSQIYAPSNFVSMIPKPESVLRRTKSAILVSKQLLLSPIASDLEEESIIETANGHNKGLLDGHSKIKNESINCKGENNIDDIFQNSSDECEASMKSVSSIDLVSIKENSINSIKASELENSDVSSSIAQSVNERSVSNDSVMFTDQKIESQKIGSLDQVEKQLIDFDNEIQDLSLTESVSSSKTMQSTASFLTTNSDNKTSESKDFFKPASNQISELVTFFDTCLNGKITNTVTKSDSNFDLSKRRAFRRQTIVSFCDQGLLQRSDSVASFDSRHLNGHLNDQKGLISKTESNFWTTKSCDDIGLSLSNNEVSLSK